MIAPFVYDNAMNDIIAGVLNLATATLKVMLVNSLYVASKADTYVDMGQAGDPKHAEINASGYVGGFGGTGRAVVTPTVQLDVGNNRVKAVFSNPLWSPLGGAQNDTVAAAILIHEGQSADTGSRLICYWPLSAPYTTNGQGFQLVMDSVNGNLDFNC